MATRGNSNIQNRYITYGRPRNNLETCFVLKLNAGSIPFYLTTYAFLPKEALLSHMEVYISNSNFRVSDALHYY